MISKWNENGDVSNAEFITNIQDIELSNDKYVELGNNNLDICQNYYKFSIGKITLHI